MSARAAKVESKASKFRVTAEGICAPSHSQTTYQTRFPRTVGSHIAWWHFYPLCRRYCRQPVLYPNNGRRCQVAF